MLRTWYEEAFSCDKAAKFSSVVSSSILYKGFKIILNLELNTIELLDIRKTDFYTKVNEEDLLHINNHGFIKGCDFIMMERDEKRVSIYTKRLEYLYTMKDEYSKDPLKNKKKLGICKNNISELIDLLFFYKSRLIQNKEKYDQEH